jgi:predicted patatin/cPLA2 family phospholipase
MNVTHPVLDVLMSRKSQSSIPGSRRDGFRVGLAVEGGGMRGVLSGAMLSALADHGLVNSFDAVYAYSAGAINAAYFVSGGGWHSLSVYYDDLIGGDFLSYRRLARGGPLVSLDFVLDTVLERRNPLDYQRLLASPIELHLIASSIDQLMPVTFKEFATREDARTVLKASACIPFVAGPPVVYRGERLVDGAVLMPHPFLAARADGCTHVLVIRTRSQDPQTGHPRAGRMTASQRLMANRLERLQPGMRDAMVAAADEYGTVAVEIRRRSSSGDGTPYVLEVGCPPGGHRVRRLTQDQAIVYQGMRTAYGAMLETLTGERREILLRPASCDNRSSSDIRDPGGGAP